MKKSAILLAAVLILIGAASIQAHADLKLGPAKAIIPQGGGDIVTFPFATFTNTDNTLPLFLTAAQDLTFQGNSGPAHVSDFTLASDIANSGSMGLEIMPGGTLFYTGKNGNPGLMQVSDDGNDPNRYKSGLHYKATYDLTYHYQGGNDVTITGIPVQFIYAPDFSVPEPGVYALLGSAALTGGLFLRRRRACRPNGP